jgi:inhibitor of KinA
VPARSVAIAGVQTGIYPSETPGGWQLIGRTPLPPFDPDRPEPFLMKAGDAVQFYAIDRAAYDRWPKSTTTEDTGTNGGHRTK